LYTNIFWGNTQKSSPTPDLIYDRLSGIRRLECSFSNVSANTAVALTMAPAIFVELLEKPSTFYATYSRKPKSCVHYSVHKNLPIDPILTYHLCLYFPNGLFPSVYRTKTLRKFLVLRMRPTCSDHHILLDLITIITLAEE
jgi:hypothetical protein